MKKKTWKSGMNGMSSHPPPPFYHRVGTLHFSPNQNELKIVISDHDRGFAPHADFGDNAVGGGGWEKRRF